MTIFNKNLILLLCLNKNLYGNPPIIAIKDNTTFYKFLTTFPFLNKLDTQELKIEPILSINPSTTITDEKNTLTNKQSKTKQKQKQQL